MSEWMEHWMEYYDVSPEGEVRSLDRDYINSRGQHRKVKSHVLKTSPDRYGYEKVTLSYDGRAVSTTVGRLVAEKYLPNPDNLPQVNHRNEDKLDNRVENLEWCTNEYNARYGTKSERSALARSRPIMCTYPDGSETVFRSASEAARALSLNQGNISACVRGDQRQTGGYTFKMLDEGGSYNG